MRALDSNFLEHDIKEGFKFDLLGCRSLNCSWLRTVKLDENLWDVGGGLNDDLKIGQVK